ncbi:peptidase [Phormidium sp. LEGE 05292]|uniref:peptidase n=1 Tax=[Phormidium] sp. LEGE 05292 TaxID=767427 RepID=UPI00187F2E85|nr:peptidase [Phormidium sp. LEGE 05292]MBE9226854.1 peptidase [Phormidium sp. LEGE 05292]
MNRAFRKYHRQIAIVAALPLILTVISGVGYTIFDEWFEQEEISTFLLKLHTLEIIHLDKFFPILNGVALIALLVTGLSMTTLFNKRRSSENSSN